MHISKGLFLLLAFFVGESSGTPRLHYVTTAEQHGIVGYRDPIGVISPDGRWLAYSEGRFLKIRHVDGGPVREFAPVNRDIRYIAWHPNSKNLAIPDRGHASEATRWFVYNIETRQKDPLWPGVSDISGVDLTTGERLTVPLSELQYLTWSQNGKSVAGIARAQEGTALWTMSADGGDARVQMFSGRLSYPVFHPTNEQLACLSLNEARQRLVVDCTDPTSALPEDQDVYGPVAFSPDGDFVYYAMPNDRGTLDLWSRSLTGDDATRLTSFARDAYAPSVDIQGRILFKVNNYHPVLAMASAAGGSTTALTAFQSETPSWNWTGSQLGFTYGNWRTVVDDFKYPDIAQDVGIINLDEPLPAEAPHSIVSASTSEDQGQSWSPNGKWIAFHSHFGPSDDIWLVPADQSKDPRQITEGTHEAGWPRWSADGKWLVYTGQKGEQASSRMFVLGIDQETGEITRAEREVPLQQFAGEVGHAEWISNGNALLFEAIEEPGKKAIYRIDRDGGRPKLVHEFDSEEKYSGIGASAQGDWVAFVAPGPRGYQQVYRLRLNGGDPQLVTSDPSNKTHPAYSPDGETIAFTVWRYESQFWVLTPN